MEEADKVMTLNDDKIRITIQAGRPIKRRVWNTDWAAKLNPETDCLVYHRIGKRNRYENTGHVIKDLGNLLAEDWEIV